MCPASPPRLFPHLDDPRPGHETLRFSGRGIDEPALAGAAASLAHRLRKDGARRIAVLTEPVVETAVAVIAGLLSGVTVVPVNPHSGALELAHQRRDSDPDLVLGPHGVIVPEPLGDVALLEVDLDPGDRARPGPDHAADGGPSPTDFAEPDPETPALVMYTSGTTGLPKGVVLPRRAVAHDLDALAEVWGWTGADVLVHALPLYHTHGLVLGVLGPVRVGGRLVHLSPFDPATLAGALAAEGTMLFAVPTMYRRLADEAARDRSIAAALGGARLLVSGSAGLPRPVHEAIERLTGQQIVERYGMTETCITTAVPAGRARPGTVGPALPGVELRLLGEDGRDVAPDDPDTMGEILVRGPTLFLGYLNAPEATGELVRDGWVHSGDLATRDADGYLRIVGRRATDLIKSGGFRIGAGEVEAALLDHPDVAEAAVAALPDPDLGDRVAAWVVRRPGTTVDAAALERWVADQLSPHKRPRRVFFVDTLPRNPMGKVQKKLLVPAEEG